MAINKTLFVFTLLLAFWCAGGAARPEPLFLDQFAQFAQLFDIFHLFDSSALARAGEVNATQLEQFFQTHGEHLRELADLAQNFGSSK